MRAAAALRDGIRRVNGAPAVLAGVWAVTLAASLPLALSVRDAIARHLGASLQAGEAAAGVNYDWMLEFAAQASGAAATVGPSVIGFGAVLDNLSDFIDREPRPIAIVAAGALYLAAWLFLAGGIIDRYARGRPSRAHAFFSACGVFFFRFLRLGAAAAIAYGVLFFWLHPLLFDEWYRALTADVTAERTAFAIRLGLYLVFGALLAGCNLVFDYAKVRAVVEDRRSTIGALAAAGRFLKGHGGAAAALYGANALLFVAVLAAYALVAPGAGSTGPSLWAGLAVSHLYVIGRLWVKLVFWASETALFQGRLAHAGYVARPQPAWPESPAAEAIR